MRKVTCFLFLIFCSCQSYSDLEKMEILQESISVRDSINGIMIKTEIAIQRIDKKNINELVSAPKLKGLILFMKDYKEDIEFSLKEEDYSEVQDLLNSWPSARTVAIETLKNDSIEKSKGIITN